MNPHAISPMSRPAPRRVRRSHEDDSATEDPFLLAVSRAFLSAVGTSDRRGTVLYSRAILSIINHGHEY